MSNNEQTMTMTATDRVGQHDKIAAEIASELIRADRHGVAFAHLNDAYFEIYEKLDDVYVISIQERNKRSKAVLRRKLIQVATMAIKGVLSIENFVEPE